MNESLVIMGLCAVIIVLLIVVIAIINKNSKDNKGADNLKEFVMYQQNMQANIIEKMGNVEVAINHDLNQFQNVFSQNIRTDFERLNVLTEKRLLDINEKVNEKLEKSFEKTNLAFTSMIERLSRIDEAQKKIEGLSNEIVSLQDVLTDKKTRGIFGEVQLNSILNAAFGTNPGVYEIQSKMPNGFIADALLKAPDPLGNIAIDSKFPLENYQRMVDKNLTDQERNEAEKLFKADVKKHIDAISTKYIIPGVTADQAIMFLPAEAIFANINAYHEDLVLYSQKKRVWIVSPTTMMSTLTLIQVILRDIERDKNAKIIFNELELLGVEFRRYRERWDKLSGSIETVYKNVKDVEITSKKIGSKFDDLSNARVDMIESNDEE